MTHTLRVRRRRGGFRCRSIYPIVHQALERRQGVLQMLLFSTLRPTEYNGTILDEQLVLFVVVGLRLKPAPARGAKVRGRLILYHHTAHIRCGHVHRLFANIIDNASLECALVKHRSDSMLQGKRHCTVDIWLHAASLPVLFGRFTDIRLADVLIRAEEN